MAIKNLVNLIIILVNNNLLKNPMKINIIYTTRLICKTSKKCAKNNSNKIKRIKTILYHKIKKISILK